MVGKLTVRNKRYSYSETFSEQEIEEMIKEMPSEEVEEYIRFFCGNPREAEKLNGKHISYGLMECLYQSDYCPHFLNDIENINELEIIWE